MNIRTQVSTSVAVDRYRVRSAAGLRHESHGDDEFMSRTSAPDFDGSVDELNLGVSAMNVDTTGPVGVSRLDRQILEAVG